MGSGFKVVSVFQQEKTLATLVVMANEEHLAKLKEGVEAWNIWRAQNVDIWPDLSEASIYGSDFIKLDSGGLRLGRPNLRWAHLSGMYPSGARLAGVNFRGVNLHGAYLGGAHLGGADLGRADLSGADLSWAALSGADLSGANLSGADLVGVNFYGAYFVKTNLSKANFHKAVLAETIFANVDLMNVKGLESCIHHGPSTIDHRTLEQSGKLPLPFLRGCGLPDAFIDHLPSPLYLPPLLNQPIQYYSCFISYASKDKAFAQRLHTNLQDRGVRCWFAPEDLKIGDKIWDIIDKAIQLRDKLLLILSRYAIDSEWVEDEVMKAYAEERHRKQTILFPIRIDEAVMETGEPWAVKLRDGRHIGDFSNWENYHDYQKGLERLLRDLQIEKDKS